MRNILNVLNKKKKCFVSLSYKDLQLFESTSSLLPDWIDPYVFPQKEITPNEMISNELINSIRRFDSFLYLNSENSAESEWVALERDYALRLKKPVFCFDPINKSFKKDSSKPLDLQIFPTYVRRDWPLVQNITDILSKERNFKMFIDVDDLHAGQNVGNVIRDAINNTLEVGGYTVLFYSQQSLKSEWVKHEYEFTLKKYADRILICIIDDALLPEELSHLQFVRVFDPLCQDSINRNLLDELIVRLYWLIYNNTRVE